MNKLSTVIKKWVCAIDQKLKSAAKKSSCCDCCCDTKSTDDPNEPNCESNKPN